MEEKKEEQYGKITVPSYEGEEPYLFVSYSHANAEEVNHVLQILDREKFRLWYDDTMEVGDDFREELRARIEKCCAMVLFVSAGSMHSKYCGMEILQAFRYGKRIYPIYLEENVALPDVLKLLLENLQHVRGDRAGSSDKQMAKLLSSLPQEAMRALTVQDGVLVKCKDGSSRITIPADVTEIGPAAFKACEKLEEVILGEHVRVLGAEAFRGCKSLRQIVLGKEVRRIGESAFRDCVNMTDVTVENDDVEIGERAFENCASLQNVHLPEGMAEIYGGVFNSCKSLQELHLPDKLTILGESSLADCVRIAHIDIPESVTKIDDMTFNGCVGLQEIALPGHLTKIGKNVFKDCAELQSVTIPASVTSIGMSPFRGCRNLTHVEVDGKSKYFKAVDNILFNKSKSTLICYPARCALHDYEIPDSVTVISDWAFCECEELSSIRIPDSVYEIGEGAFYRCVGLHTVVIPDSVIRIDDIAFRGCSEMETMVIPDSVKDFGWGVLNGCDKVTVICSDTSAAAAYCDRKGIPHKRSL